RSATSTSRRDARSCKPGGNAEEDSRTSMPRRRRACASVRQRITWPAPTVGPASATNVTTRLPVMASGDDAGYGVHDFVDLFVGEVRIDRQAEHLLVHVFADGQTPGREHCVHGDGVVVDRYVVDLHGDALRAELVVDPAAL